MDEPLRYCSFFTTHPEQWKPCSKEHHDMVKANPKEWPGYEVMAMVGITACQVLIPRALLTALLDGDSNVSLAAAQELRAILAGQ